MRPSHTAPYCVPHCVPIVAPTASPHLVTITESFTIRVATGHTDAIAYTIADANRFSVTDTTCAAFTIAIPQPTADTQSDAWSDTNCVCLPGTRCVSDGLLQPCPSGPDLAHVLAAVHHRFRVLRPDVLSQGLERAIVGRAGWCAGQTGHGDRPQG